MKFTLLAGVQEVLSSLDSDEVNSINDTVESYQVALIFKSVYYDIFNDLDLIEHETNVGLEASTDSDQQVLMTMPDNVTRISWIKYDNKDTGETNPNYLDVTYLPFEEFISMQQALRNDTTNVDSMTITGDNDDTFSVMYRTNAHPSWYTFYDNHSIIFDALDETVDTTLQQSKFLCMGHVYPEFSLVDEFVPDLDPTQFRYYLHRCKIRAFAELKQAPNQEAASEARRQKIITQKRKHSIATRAAIFDLPARYGRK